jgi:DNA-binding transcriptional regulator YiaG
VNLASLVNINPVVVRPLVTAIDPLVLPAFLELGSILFLSAAFARNRRNVTERVEKPCESVDEIDVPTVPEIRKLSPTESALRAKVFSKVEALADMRKLKEVGTQKFLAERYGVSEATVSKWLKDWQTNGDVARPRDGRKKQVLALPPPRGKPRH